MKDTNGNSLVPGNMYAELFSDEYGDGVDSYGRLMWYSSRDKFFDSDDGEEIIPDCDGFVHQPGHFAGGYVEED